MGFEDKIGTLQSDASSAIQQRIALNKDLVMKNKYEGRGKIIFAAIQRIVGKNTKILCWAAFIAVAVILFQILSFYVVIPAAIAAFVVFAIADKDAATPFIDLTEDQKSPEYRELENRLNNDMSSITDERDKYQAFSVKSSIAGFISAAETITGPDPDGYGEYNPLVESDELQQTMSFINRKIASNLKDATELYNQQVNGRAMVDNTARTASAVENYGVSAARSAQSAQASAGVAGTAASAAVASAGVAGAAANSAVGSAGRANNAANAAAGAAGRANASANSAAGSASRAASQASSAAASASQASSNS